MKHRLVKGSLALIAFLLVMALFVAPFFIGLYAKHEIAIVLDNTTSPYAIKTKIISSDSGWFHSSMKVKIWLENPSHTALTGNITTFNGPFILFKDWRGNTHWYFNWFAAKGYLNLHDTHLNKHIQAELPYQVFIAIRQNLSLDSFIHIHSPEIALHIGDKKIRIGGITLRLFHATHHNHITINSLINDTIFDFPSHKTRLDLQYAALTLNIKRDETGLWTGTTKIFAPTAFLFDSAGRAEFKNSTIITKTDSTDAKHYFDITAHTDKIKIENEITGPLDISGFIRHFYDKDLGHFFTIQKYVSELNLPTDLRNQALNPFITQLIQGVSAHITKAHLKTPSGTIKAGFSIKFPSTHAHTKSIPSFNQIARQSLAEFKLLTPIATIKQQNILGRTLQQFFNNGWFVKKGNEYIMHIQHTPQGYLMNGKPWLEKLHATQSEIK